MTRARVAVPSCCAVGGALAAPAARRRRPSSASPTSRGGRASFTHNNGAFGKKYLPETLGAGAAFFDFDNDGRQDLFLVNGANWPGQPNRPAAAGSFAIAATARSWTSRRAAGLASRCTAWAWPSRIRQRRLAGILLVTAVGQNRLFRNTGKGTFVDVTARAGLGSRVGFSTSALWFDYDRDGWLDLLVCNYVRWTPETDVQCSMDGKQKAYCTPEAYRGATSWLFRNRGNGTFEDVTAKAGLFDATSKSLGVTLVEYDADPWPDVFIANDTQPNKLYRNNGNGTFIELGLKAGLALSEEGRARAGMGVDAADVDNSGTTTVVITNFSGEMLGLYRPVGDGQFQDAAPRSEVGRATRRRWGSAASSSTSISTACRICWSSTATSTTRFTRANAASPTPSRRTCSTTAAAGSSPTSSRSRRRLRAAQGRPWRGVCRHRRRPRSSTS